MTVIAVRRELVTWARDFRGLNLEEAADKLSVSIDELRAIENGQKDVNLTFFRKLSDRLRIPRATLLRQTPPSVPPMPIDFRTFDGQRPTIGFDARLAISYAYTIEQNILELVDTDAAPPTPVFPVLSLKGDPEQAGERERRRIGPTFTAQMGWRFDGAFRNWRSFIETTGAYVLLKKFDLADCRGFTIFRDANAPIIMVNKSEMYEPARTFTLLHEYAHLLLRQPGISDQNDANPVEAFCNQFAAAFMMPRGLLVELLPQWPSQPVEWEIDDIRLWARRMKVSQQALALRLEGLGVAPQGFYARLVRLQRGGAHRVREQDGGNYVNTQVFELGDRYTGAILQAQQREAITTGEAAEMLDLAPRHFEGVRARYDRRDYMAGDPGH